MITLEPPPHSTAPKSSVETDSDDLLDLQLCVARRADVIAHRLHATARDADRRIWLRAEFEVFERSEKSLLDRTDE